MAKTKARIKARKLKSKIRSTKKIKNKKAAAKRFKVTATGLVKVAHCGKQHNAKSKNRSRKNKLKKLKVVSTASKRHLVRCLPTHF